MNLEEKVLNLYKKEYKTTKQQRVVDILKIILVDKETDPDKIVNLTATTLVTIGKYAYDKELITQFLTEEEYEIFKQKIDVVLNSKEKNKKAEEEKIIRNIIDDIFNTRYKIEDIYRKNFVTRNKIETLFFKTDYLDNTYGLGMKDKVKIKITENGLLREKKPRNSIFIEDRWDVFVANPDVYYLNELDFRKLKLASSYLCSGADMNYVTKKHEISAPAVISILCDLKLQSILNPVCYENLKRYISIENVLINNELSAKKTLLFNVVHVLNESNFDKQLTANYFNLPICLFDKLLKEITLFPFFDENIRNNVKNLLNEETTKKVK